MAGWNVLRHSVIWGWAAEHFERDFTSSLPRSLAPFSTRLDSRARFKVRYLKIVLQKIPNWLKQGNFFRVEILLCIFRCCFTVLDSVFRCRHANAISHNDGVCDPFSRLSREHHHHRHGPWSKPKGPLRLGVIFCQQAKELYVNLDSRPYLSTK